MNSSQIDALIKEIKDRKAKYHDLTFAAGPGTTDPEAIEIANRAAECEAEYDSLLAIIEGRGGGQELGSSHVCAKF